MHTLKSWMIHNNVIEFRVAITEALAVAWYWYDAVDDKVDAMKPANSPALLCHETLYDYEIYKKAALCHYVLHVVNIEDKMIITVPNFQMSI